LKASNLIKVNETNFEFHLTNKSISYVFRVLENSKQLEHLYYGKNIHHSSSFDYLIERESRPANNLYEDNHTSSFEHTKQEYPSFGTTDFREPAFLIKNPAGDKITHFAYEDYTVLEGKPKIEGLPATYTELDSEAETLCIHLKDIYTDLKLNLYYTIYKDHPVITRRSEFINVGSQNHFLESAMSMSIDFPEDNFELLHLNGAWARENHVSREPLTVGKKSLSSARGASGPVNNPFLALVREETTEHSGEAYGFSFVYSGNFKAQVEVNTYNVSRVMMGINPFNFSWKLEPNETFSTPEVVMVYSDKGLNKMSQTYHNLYRSRLARGKWRDTDRPILINSWEATYYDFNEDKILDIAKQSAELGIELFVLDDGWFGQRDTDDGSLGNWTVDKRKLPNGLNVLSEKIHDLGMKFGLWFEPEMVSKDTKIFKENPNWVIHVPGKNVSHGRNQYILDFSNPDVVNNLFNQMDNILSDVKIEYIKWDMNRYISEAYSSHLNADRQGELFHRYILGVYSLFERLQEKYPDILFESCAGGGGRFDPGMLYYSPQIWASDDTDAIERLKIQYGTSMVYPLSSIGSHVSEIPNHQVGRNTPIETRANVAFFGTFGYELDITKLSSEEKNIVSEQIAFFKKYRTLIHSGNFYRLKSPFNSNEVGWMVVSQNRTEALIGYYQVLSQPNAPYERLKLKGLDENKKYKVSPGNEIRYGNDLENIGLLFSQNNHKRKSSYWSQNNKSDFNSRILHIEEV